MSSVTIILIVAIIAATNITTMYWFIRAEQKRARIDIQQKSVNTIIPNRLQAYERMALFLERITPESMVIREQNNAITSLEFHTLLLRTIRQEFEHNIAMQIYISTDTWRRITRAKEEIIKMINTTAKETNPQMPALKLGQDIIENAPDECKFYITKALDAIRKDVQEMFVL